MGPPVAHGVFDPTPRDADVGERTIVELMELADGAAQESFGGQVARQPGAPRARALSHSANSQMVPRMQSLMMILRSMRVSRSACKNKDSGMELFLSNLVGSVAGRFSQQPGKFNGAGRGCPRA